MQVDIPDSARAYGFVTGPTSTHTSRTMILRELSLLLGSTPPDASYDELRQLVVEENVTLKATQAGRKETFRRLRELYSLKRNCVIYRALRDLWDTDVSEQPILAILCATARDSLLRETAPAVLEQPSGSVVTPQMISEALEAAYPDRFSPIIRAGFGRHAISSWEQSGHLSGRMSKVRARACSGPTSTAYALFLGHLCGSRGAMLYETFWAKVLDQSPADVDHLAFRASQRGLIDYRRIGDVVDISFSHLTRSEETR